MNKAEPIIVDARAIVVVSLLVNALFLVLYLVVHVWLGADGRVDPHPLVDVDAEESFPTWWQQVQLAAAGLVALFAAAVHRRVDDPDARRWSIIGGVLVFLSVDEGAQIHERLIDPMRDLFDISSYGPLAFAWVIPGAAVVVIFVAFHLRFWLDLPAAPRLFIGLGGLCYVAGAIGMEMVGGAFGDDIDPGTTHRLAVAAEETLEGVGITLLL